MTRRGFTKTELIVVLAILGGLMFCCAPFGFWPAELVVFLAIGWIPFLGRVGPEIEPDWGAVALGCIALAVFAVGLHALLRWFYAALPAKNITPESATPQLAPWRLRWTLSAVALIVMLFVAGISMVGITHQFAWMATAEEPLTRGPRAGFRMSSQNNLKQMAISLHNYHDVEMSFAPGLIAARDGQALHGWQTLILPYHEQKPLYDTIDMAKPWNNPSQKQAFTTKISVYEVPKPDLPREDPSGYALSHYAANQHILGGTRKLKLDEITDGTANTILAGEAAGNYKPWGHPRNWRDPALGINATPDGFGSPWPGGANVAMADGSIKFLSDKIAPEVLRALATPAGNEKLPEDY
jgi:prepilin-type processing-associated H-X9-DG protein